jgi:flagellar basal-body rod protein FlgB
VLKDVLFRESIPALQDGMDAASLRQKVIADNIANAGTPGFQARHVLFEELLRKGAPQHQLKLAQPEGRTPLGADDALPAAPRIEIDTSPNLKSGINNVDIEREMAGLQRNSLVHAALSQLIAAKYRLLRQAITDR